MTANPFPVWRFVLVLASMFAVYQVKRTATQEKDSSGHAPGTVPNATELTLSLLIQCSTAPEAVVELSARYQPEAAHAGHSGLSGTCRSAYCPPSAPHVPYWLQPDATLDVRATSGTYYIPVQVN